MVHVYIICDLPVSRSFPVLRNSQSKWATSLKGGKSHPVILNSIKLTPSADSHLKSESVI